MLYTYFLFRVFCYPSFDFYIILWHNTLQIQAAVLALRNTRGLPWPKDYKKKKDEDILDWLQAMFGFQVKQRKFLLKHPW